MQRVDISIVALSSPILIGIYENNKLIEEIKSFEKTSEVLPQVFDKIFKEYEVNAIFFAKGPGSFMSIKLVYIFLKTINIVKGIPLFATDGFYFTNSPIKAIGNRYFIKKDKTIEIVKLENVTTTFTLPTILERDKFDTNIDPLYVLPAVELQKDKNDN